MDELTSSEKALCYYKAALAACRASLRSGAGEASRARPWCTEPSLMRGNTIANAIVIAVRFLPAVAVALLAACQAPTPPQGSTTAAAAIAALPANAVPTVLVHKRATCHCCSRWIEHLRKSGLNVVEDNREDLTEVRRTLGVPERLASCHTAEVAGYFVEGHVPADDIVRLVVKRPNIRGLAVPGMPAGAPGMEGGHEAYAVFVVQQDGSVRSLSAGKGMEGHE